MSIKINDKVYNPDLIDSVIYKDMDSSYEETEDTRLSPNYIGIVTNIGPKIKNTIFVEVAFRDYNGYYNMDILEIVK